MAILDDVFTPIAPNVANFNISILWSSRLNEQDNRMHNNGTWNPNHFVPLLSPSALNEIDNTSQTRPPAVVSYWLIMSVYECELFFRLLKRERTKIILLLK